MSSAEFSLDIIGARLLTDDKVDVLDRTLQDRLFVDTESPGVAVGDEGELLCCFQIGIV